MAEEKPDPIANTAAFRAFSADDHGADPAGISEPERRRPSPLVLVTAIVVLAALIIGVLAAAL